MGVQDDCGEGHKALSGQAVTAGHGLEGVGENKGVFYPPTADAADWDCGDPTEAHSCATDADNHGLHDWGTQDDGQRHAFACASAGEMRGNRGSRGDAAVCNNGVPPPNCPTCNCALSHKALRCQSCTTHQS